MIYVPWRHDIVTPGSEESHTNTAQGNHNEREISN